MKKEYQKDPKRVEEALRKKGIIVVIGRVHARNAGDVINTVLAVMKAGYVAEVTFRIPEEILKEAMNDLLRFRIESFSKQPENPLILGVGSIINPREMETAIEMGFDMIVSPDSGMSGSRENIDSVRMTREANVFHMPGAFSPSEFSYFLERDDGLEPNGIKIFNSSVYGPSGIGGLLAPYQRDRHRDKIINTTGGVNAISGPHFQEQIRKYDFFPVLGMSSPLKMVTKTKKFGDPEILEKSLRQFEEEFTPFQGQF